MPSIRCPAGALMALVITLAAMPADDNHPMAMASWYFPAPSKVF
jgi:hypothetical protein